MSKQLQWVAWIGATGVLLWLIFKPKAKQAVPAAQPGSTFAVPQTGAAITAAGAAAAAKPTGIVGTALGAIPGLQNLVNSLTGKSPASGPKLPNVSAGFGGGSGGNPAQDLAKKNADARLANQANPPFSDTSGTYDAGSDVTSIPWDSSANDSFAPYSDTSGTYDPGFAVTESPYTDSNSFSAPLDAATVDPGGELQSAPLDVAPIDTGSYWDQPVFDDTYA